MRKRRLLKCSKYVVLTLLILFFTFLITGNTVKAEPEMHENIGENDYNIWNRTCLSYIVPVQNGGYMIFYAGERNYSEGYIVEYYDNNYNLVSSRIISAELPIFGRFYSDGNNYYLVTGQDNDEESDSCEVYRITKYDTDWIRQGMASLYGCNTSLPFGAGSVDMVSSNDKLFIRTCHFMYKFAGQNHQANMTMLIDTSDMSVLDSRYGISNSKTGYSSHSFNQLADFDGNYFVGVDHGDSEPRSIMITRYKNAASSGSLSGVDVFFPYSFAGEAGNNKTGASIGGFGISSSSYLVSANCIQQGVPDSSTRNILIATVNKSTGETGTRWITSNAEGDENCTTPYLIKINDNKFLVLWSKGSKVQYAFVDGNGNLQGSINETNGMISDCRPVFHDGKVVWYTYDGKRINFFEINGTTGEFVSRIPITIDFARVEEIPDTVYTGSAKEPEVTVTLRGGVLKRDVDYTVQYENNINAGLAKVIITGKGMFDGSVSKLFSIKPKDLNELSVSPVPDITYTGNWVKPEIVIKDGDTVLEEEKDYIAGFYADGEKVGTRYMKVTGRRNYTGSIDVPYVIVRADIENATINDISDQNYNGSEITVRFSVRMNNKELLKNTDYTVEFSNNKNVGTATITVTGNGNYKGTKKKTFRIIPRDINKTNVLFEDNYPSCYYKYYTGKAYKPKVSITDGSTTLVENKDYTVSYSDNVNAGRGKVTINGIGNYGETREYTFSIFAKSIKDLDFSWEKEYDYNGSAIVPIATVRDRERGVVLKENEDYTVECMYNTTAGWSNIVFKGQNNYSNSYSGVFYINPRDIATTTITLEKNDWYYSGKAVEPKVIVKADKKTLKEGTDYTLSYSNNVKVGTGTITVTGIDNCYGTASIPFEIKDVMPAISLKKIDAGVEITWTAVEIADKYRVYKKNADGGWDKISTLKLLKYVDETALPGDSNTYTVRVIDASGKLLGQYGEGKSISFTTDPVEVKLENKAAGVLVSWEAVENAAKYRIFRKKVGDTSWEKLSTTTSLKYSDKKAVFSETYLYSVRAMTTNGNFINRYGNGTEIKYTVGAPKLTLSNGENGIDITWKPMTNAAKYKVYVKNSKGTWTRLATIKSGTTYTDTTAEQGRNYTYSVIGLDADGHVMNENGDGYSLVRNNTFINVEAECTTDGLILFWDAYMGAAKYRVYRKNASGKWTKLATVTENVYADADATVNAENVYAVLAIDSDGNKLSDYGNGKAFTFVIPPTSVAAVTKSGGVRVEWVSVIKAEKYALYRKTKSTDWAKVGTTAGLSYTDKSAESGKTYYYSVIALDASGKALNDYGNGYSIKYTKPKSDDAVIEEIEITDDADLGEAIEEDSEIKDEDVIEEDSETKEEDVIEEDSETKEEDVIEEDSETKDEDVIEEDSETREEEIIEEDSETKDETEIEETSETKEADSVPEESEAAEELLVE